MGQKHIRTIGDCYRHNCLVLVECRCGHSRRIEPAEVERSGARHNALIARLRFRCSQCGSTQVTARPEEAPTSQPKRHWSESFRR